MIPENVHTIPGAASWNSKGEGRFLGLEFQRHGVVTQFRIPKAWEGFSSELGEFSRGKTVKLLLEIADLLTFLVC